MTAASPRNIRIIAAIPNLYATARRRHDVLRDRRRRQVFAAGAFTLARFVWQRHVRQLLGDLWTAFSTEGRARIGGRDDVVYSLHEARDDLRSARFDGLRRSRSSAAVSRAARAR